MEFDWDSSDAIVVTRSDAIAVYDNGSDVVIRQHDPACGDDSIIIVNRRFLRDLIEALMAQVDE